MARRRPGYTLLEILVASVIGLMLMAGLYAAFTLIIADTSTGRDLTAESNLARGIINRVGIDLNSPVGVLGPKSGGNPTAGGGGTDGTGSTPSSGGTTTPTTAQTTDTGGTTSTDPSNTAVTTGSDIPFQAGLVGTEDRLVVFLTRTPEYLRKRATVFDPSAPQPADLVKVTYYLHSSGKGLCRQERPWVTSDGVWNSTDPDRSTEEEDKIAPEVVGVRFDYASGSGYIAAWDGSGADAAGATNKGPPRAVRMTLTLEFTLRDGSTVNKDVSHVYPLRAAIGTGGSTTAASSSSSASDTSSTPSSGGTP